VYRAASMRLPAGTTALLVAAVLSACGGDDGDDLTTTTTRAAAGTGPCSGIEEVDIAPFTHVDTDLTAADYPTNPPTGGDHNDGVLEAGTVYSEPPRLGEAVHFLEHGAVIGWTNDLSAKDQKAVEKVFDDVSQDGYYQLAVVENPDLEAAFALSAWGAVQACNNVDTSIIRPFVEQWYASPKSGESVLACEGRARQLPPC
jgi:hypothetical protein